MATISYEKPRATSATSTPFTVPAAAGDDYHPISELADEFLRLGKTLEEAFASVSEERFGTVEQDDGRGAKSFLQRLVFHAWHEAPHLGQLSALRKEVGLLVP